jgi:hypothetical protein
MTSVGLITFHHVPNFGACLQAWSLVRTMMRMGCSVEVIDYRPPSLAPITRRKGLKALIPSIGQWRMRRFMSRNLPLTPTFTTHDQVLEFLRSRRYDCLVCGSDQIWMMDDRIGFDRTYYLDFGKDVPTRRVSYAPSCGNMTSYGSYSAEVGRIFSAFHAISARDENTLRLLESVGVRGAAHVVDPTLLADFDSITQKAAISGDYLAVVGPVNAAACQFIKQIAAQLKLPVVAAGTHCPAADVEKRYVDAGEWASCIRNARFVVTSLFHGSALSIAFRRPFIAIDAGGRGFKLADLLNRFALADQFVQSGADGSYSMREGLLETDYKNAEGRISQAVAASLNYLRTALMSE